MARTTEDSFINNKVSLAGLPDAWWAWWAGIQPNGRGGLLLRIDQNLDWSCLRVAGINGLISVIAVLLWWGIKVLDGGDRRVRWLEAVDDVCWALSRMNLPLPDKGDADDDQEEQISTVKKRK